MRITDDRLDELVDALVTGVHSSPSWTDDPAILLALTELQDRRDDQYEDADENYETALDLLRARDADADTDDYSYEDYTNPEADYDGDISLASWDEGEGYLNADGSDEEDEDAHLPPWRSPRWGYTGGDADDGYPDFDPDDVNDDVNRNEAPF